MSNTGGLSAPVIAKPGPDREAARPAASADVSAAPPAVTRDEVDILIRRAGLSLNAGQKADLAVSYQLIVALTGRIPRARPIWDEPCFTALPPTPPAPAAASPKPAPKGRAAKPAAKTAARPAARGKPAPKPTRPKAPKAPPRAAKPARKPARTRR